MANSQYKAPARSPLATGDPLRPGGARDSDHGSGGNHANGVHRYQEQIKPATETAYDVEGGVEAEVVALRAENARLKQMLEHARIRLEQSDRAAEAWRLREQEYEGLLEEKSEVIRKLHAELNERPARPAAEDVPSEEELIALHEELQREREQLKQDEEALMNQVRDMEIQMSKERAQLARQRAELTRMENELKHQLELAARDVAMRERLGPLYKLQEDLMRKRGGK